MQVSGNSKFSLRARQAGVVTLVVSLLLVGASMLALRGVSRASVMEVKMTSNEQQANEALFAAEAALDYGLAWYVQKEPAWTVSGTDEVGAPDVVVPTTAASNGDTYTSTVTYTRAIARKDFILITATATAASNAAVTATVRQWVHSNLLLPDPSYTGPPMLIDGCLDPTTGTPDIFPGGAGTTAVATSQPPDCIDQGFLDYNGGAEQHSAFTGDIWDQMFRVSRADMKATADAEVAAGVADADRTVVWVTSSANYHQSWGSPSKPVVVIFAPSANCPKTNGSPVFYGVVFMDSPCSWANGWGGTEIFGTLAVNGDMTKITSNSEITDWGMVGSGDLTELKLNWVARIPGSWRDY